MKEKLIQAERIVSTRYNKNDKNYGILVISCYCLLTKFEIYTPLIKDLYENCEFYIGNKPLLELLHDGNFNIQLLDKNIDINEIVGLSITGNNLVFGTEKNKTKKQPPQIFCSTIHKETEALDTIIHELSHLLKSKIHNVYIDSNGNKIKRSGLQIEIENNKEYLNIGLDEAINTLQTSEMTEEVKRLNPNIMSIEVKSFYDKLNFAELGGISGNEIISTLLLLLWNNEHFKSNIENNIIEGNLDTIENDFNQVMKNNQAFKVFSEAFDIVITRDKLDKIALNRVAFIINMSKIYNIKSKAYKTYIKS